jgi:hypothetical protein
LQTTVTDAPTTAPTAAPIVGTESPTMEIVTIEPTLAPVVVTEAPTSTPVVGPTTSVPTAAPTGTPTTAPTLAPQVAPTTLTPTIAPQVAPTTLTPTIAPTLAPTLAPTAAPTVVASDAPSLRPSGAPIPLVPTPTPVQIVRVTDYYISFVAPDATREPTQAEYDEMLRRINEWFQMTFMEQYANNPETQFIGSVASNDFTLFGVNNNIPPRPADFNIYMNFDFSEFTYTENSVVPTTSEAFEIMRASITRDFILEVVRTYTGTPFESTDEVFFAASEFTQPP